MRVLALGPESFGGFAGIAQGTRDFLSGLVAAPHVESVRLLARREADGGPEPPPEIVGEVRAGNPLRFVQRATSLASTRRFDMVFCLHVNLMPVAVYLRRVFDLPVWLAIHGIEAWEPPSQLLRRRAVAHADLITSSSRYTRSRFLEWAHVEASRVVVNNNPVHLEQWGPGPKPPELLDRYGLRGRRVLMTLGRMLGGGRYKGHDEIIDVLPELGGRFPNLTWMIVGDGPDRERIEKRVQAAGQSDRVIFTGRISEEEKRAHYLVADAYALPSLTEGFGIAYLEAAACGLPVLGSSRDGSRDALADGVIGVLVDPENSRELLGGLTRILGRQKLVPTAIQRFTFDAMAARMRGLLEEHFPSELQGTV